VGPESFLYGDEKDTDVVEEQGKAVVEVLHETIWPFPLRRVKSDVERAYYRVR